MVSTSVCHRSGGEGGVGDDLRDHKYGRESGLLQYVDDGCNYSFSIMLEKISLKPIRLDMCR